MTVRRVVVAPDKFKGSLTAAEVASALRDGLLAAQPDLDVVMRPVADGGDGTVDAVVSAGFDRVWCEVEGPTGEVVTASYARQGELAVIEMAEASGLSRLPGGVRQPLTASTFGTGQLMLDAIRSGCNHLVVGLGGSATTDGGTGLLSALGARFLDADGEGLPPGGGALSQLARVELGGLDSRLADVHITLASDVAVPLCGPSGAAAMFGPQKGATSAQVKQLDDGLARLAALVARALDRDASIQPGAGAAGGTGFALLSVLRAAMKPGIDVVLDAIGFDDVVRGADLVITGEGAVDTQTLEGKAPMGVLRRAQAAGATVVVVGGRLDLTEANLQSHGFAHAWSLSSIARQPQDAFTQAPALLRQIAALILASEPVGCR